MLKCTPVTLEIFTSVNHALLLEHLSCVLMITTKATINYLHNQLSRHVHQVETIRIDTLLG